MCMWPYPQTGFTLQDNHHSSGKLQETATKTLFLQIHPFGRGSCSRLLSILAILAVDEERNRSKDLVVGTCVVDCSFGRHAHPTPRANSKPPNKNTLGRSAQKANPMAPWQVVLEWACACWRGRFGWDQNLRKIDPCRSRHGRSPAVLGGPFLGGARPRPARRGLLHHAAEAPA